MTLGPGLGAPVQVAYAVPDVFAAAARWAVDFGAGPFFVRSHIDVNEVVHRGRPATFDHSSAYGQWGSIMVELVHDHGDGPSVVRDLYQPDQSGLHHLAFFVDDVASSVLALAERGHQLAMSARTPGGTAFHFVDAVATCGHFLELYQRSERLQGFYEMVAGASRGWNGADPVRSL